MQTGSHNGERRLAAVFAEALRARRMAAGDDYSLGYVHGKQDGLIAAYSIMANLSVESVRDRLRVEDRRSGPRGGNQ